MISPVHEAMHQIFIPVGTATMRATTASLLTDDTEMPTADELPDPTPLYRGPPDSACPCMATTSARKILLRESDTPEVGIAPGHANSAP